MMDERNVPLVGPSYAVLCLPLWDEFNVEALSIEGLL